MVTVIWSLIFNMIEQTARLRDIDNDAVSYVVQLFIPFLQTRNASHHTFIKGQLHQTSSRYTPVA